MKAKLGERLKDFNADELPAGLLPQGLKLIIEGEAKLLGQDENAER